MRVILVSAKYQPELVAPCVAEAERQGWGGKGGVMCLEPTALAATGDELPATCPRVVAADYISESGAFAHIRLVKRLAALLDQGPATLVLDSTSNTTRYSDLDMHGYRAAELPALIAKTLYWMPAPPVVVHFVPPSMKPYYVREWGVVVEYAPVETLHVRGQDVAAQRIEPIWQRAQAKRVTFTPARRLKHLLWRTVLGRVYGLAIRLRPFR